MLSDSCAGVGKSCINTAAKQVVRDTFSTAQFLALKYLQMWCGDYADMGSFG